jgi:hypothetical protein
MCYDTYGGLSVWYKVIFDPAKRNVIIYILSVHALAIKSTAREVTITVCCYSRKEE